MVDMNWEDRMMLELERMEEDLELEEGDLVDDFAERWNLERGGDLVGRMELVS